VFRKERCFYTARKPGFSMRWCGGGCVEGKRDMYSWGCSKKAWGHSLPARNSSSQSTCCGISNKSGIVQNRKVRKQTRKSVKQESRVRKQTSELNMVLFPRKQVPCGCITHFLHAYMRTCSRASSSKCSMLRTEAYIEYT